MYLFLDVYLLYRNSNNNLKQKIMRNETEFIKSTSERTLTAKAYRFVWKCIDIIADQNGLHRYSKELKPLKEKLHNLLVSLFIDEGLSINEIKELIKNRTLHNALN